MEKVLFIKNKSGLHARPSGILAKTANGFQSNIVLESNGKTINAKSIMSIMSSGLSQNSEVKLIINGPDEDKAFDCIVDLFESGFGEL